MDFSKALKLLKQGLRIYRLGWNATKRGLTTYIEMVPARHDDQMTYKSYLQMVYLTDHPFTVIGWLASQEDMLSDDWEICEA